MDSLDQTLERVKREGVKTLSTLRKSAGMRAAFVQAPDNVELELVGGHSAPPN